MLRTTLTLALLLFVGNVPAQIFKCIDEKGKTAFQDKPCAKGGEAVLVSPASGAAPARSGSVSSAATPPATPAAPGSTALSAAEREANQLKSMEADRKRRALDYEIRDTEADIAALQARFDRELAELRYRRQFTANNLAGATLDVAISNEMQAVTEKYGIQIKAAQDRLLRLQQDRALAMKGP